MTNENHTGRGIMRIFALTILGLMVVGCGKENPPVRLGKSGEPLKSVKAPAKKLTKEDIVGTYVQRFPSGIKLIFKFSRNGRFEYINDPTAYNPTISISRRGGTWKLSNEEVVFSYDKQSGAATIAAIKRGGNRSYDILTIVAELVNGVRTPKEGPQYAYRKE